MIKINFKQPKYIFPLVVFFPLCALIYFVMETFKSSDKEQLVATDRINMELPDAHVEETGDKMTEMARRFGDEDAFTAVGAIGDEKKVNEEVDHGYSEEELNKLDAAEAQRLREQKEMEDLERSLAESKRHINSYVYGGDNFSDGEEGSMDEESFAQDLQRIQRRSRARQRALESSLGLEQPEEEERRLQHQADSLARVRKEEQERNRPYLVIKTRDSNADKFNTVSSEVESADAKLIRAMIDQTTKAHEGTRLRFKLLDNVSVQGVKLKKGTYLYGTVTGFGQQRVRANITSILVGDRFLKVNLSVFDNDGMEGFYVPESSFRDFMKDASAGAVQQNMNLDAGGNYGNGISGEALALQALQNVYSSATSAVSSNIRKNKAKIKYNTIVYLINSEDAR